MIDTKRLTHALMRLQMQRRYLCLIVIDMVSEGDFLEAQRYARFFKIIDRKCKVYAGLKDAII